MRQQQAMVTVVDSEFDISFAAAHCEMLFVFRDVSVYPSDCVSTVVLSACYLLCAAVFLIACRHVFLPCSQLLLELNEV